MEVKTGVVRVRIDPKYFRLTEVPHLEGDPTKAHQRLGWRHEISFADLVSEMMEADLELMRRVHRVYRDG